jgi:hypothetical protein
MEHRISGMIIPHLLLSIYDIQIDGWGKYYDNAILGRGNGKSGISYWTSPNHAFQNSY